MTASDDPLAVGQQLVAILDEGRRTGTYKLAVAVALLDLAVEQVPADPATVVSINLGQLTERVMDLYWGQLRPFLGSDLKQSTDGRSVLLGAVAGLRAKVPGRREVPLETAQRLVPHEYQRCADKVLRFLVRYPLKRLQRAGRSNTHECFLYDDSWLGSDSVTVIADHGNQVELYPGIGHALARLAPLLKPAFQLAWVHDVQRMNKAVLGNEPDIAHHLFGADRVSLARPAEILVEEFGSVCFYCASAVTKHRHVDHVLPWSRVPLNGLSNLVIGCRRCNSDKSDYLPEPVHVARALDRGRERLQGLADSINWPSQFDRVDSAARGLYSTVTAVTPVWHAPGRIEPLSRIDFVWPR